MRSETGADVVLEQPEVSSRHLLIRVTEGGAGRFYAVELGSHNGTMLENERLVAGEERESPPAGS